MESSSGGNTSLRALMFNDKMDTPNLGDFLRVKEDNYNSYSNNTLGAVLSNKRECASSSSYPVHSSRTLLDIIRDDPNSSSKNRKWKHFRNKLRLKPTSNISMNPTMSRRLSRDVVATYPEVENLGEPEIMGVENEPAEEETGVELEDQPVRVSLMALLTENDGDESAYVMGDEEEEEEEDDDDDGVVIACGEYNNCCVCMERHKGAAFIPCGHTFCRLCSRDLWVQRANCPLCNNFILEVLHIF